MVWLSLIAAIVLIAVVATVFILQSNRKKEKNFKRLKEELKVSEKEKETIFEKVPKAEAAVLEVKDTVLAEPLEVAEAPVEETVPPEPPVVEEEPVEEFESKPKYKIIHYEKFDNSRAVDQLGLSQEDADIFVKELIEQIEEELPKLETAIEKKEFKQIDDISHMIKGSSSSLGSGGVADLLTEMNEYCKKGRDIEIIENYLYNLKHYFNELKTQFA